jgi:hypothetical protein
MFERENPNRLWRAPIGTPANSPIAQRAAGLVERQNVLARIRIEMRAEGADLATEEESLAEASGSRNYVLPQR